MPKMFDGARAALLYLRRIAEGTLTMSAGAPKAHEKAGHC
jgi:hypothetical protein